MFNVDRLPAASFHMCENQGEVLVMMKYATAMIRSGPSHHRSGSERGVDLGQIHQGNIAHYGSLLYQNNEFAGISGRQFLIACGKMICHMVWARLRPSDPASICPESTALISERYISHIRRGFTPKCNDGDHHFCCR